MLTARQRQLFEFIDGELQRTGGIAPSYQEMAVAIGASSRGDAHNLLRRIEKRGYIRRLPNRVRAIEVIRREPPVIPWMETAETERLYAGDEFTVWRGSELIGLFRSYPDSARQEGGAA